MTSETMSGDRSPSNIVDFSDPEEAVLMDPIDHDRCRYPYCIVWTPIPVLTWIFPFLGHMGICTSSGVIRDFAGPYFVSEDLMAFGKPTKYWQLSPQKANNGQAGWDAAVAEASEIYKKRMVQNISNYTSYLFFYNYKDKLTIDYVLFVAHIVLRQLPLACSNCSQHHELWRLQELEHGQTCFLYDSILQIRQFWSIPEDLDTIPDNSSVNSGFGGNYID